MSCGGRAARSARGVISAPFPISRNERVVANGVVARVRVVRAEGRRGLNLLIGVTRGWRTEKYSTDRRDVRPRMSDRYRTAVTPRPTADSAGGADTYLSPAMALRRVALGVARRVLAPVEAGIFGESAHARHHSRCG